MATIQGVYLALFGRPADPLGLQFFNGVTKNGADLSGIGPLQNEPEFTKRFEGQTNAQIINSIYKSLFNRDADLGGLSFYAAELAAGRLSINNIAIAIYDGAQGADKTIRDLKEAAANAFTTALDTAAEITGYSGDTAAASGRAFIAGVTTTAPTAAQIDAAVVAATTNGGAGSGQTFTLTVGDATLAGGTGKADDFSKGGTTADDTFNAQFANSLETGDVLNGLAGTDTLNATLGGAAGAAVTPTLTDIETINVSRGVGGFAALDLNQSTGYKTLTLSNSGSNGGLGVSGISSLGTTVNIKDANNLTVPGGSQGISVGYTNAAASGADDKVTINLNNVGTAAGIGNGTSPTLTVHSGPGSTSGIENLTLNVTGANARLNTLRSETFFGSGNEQLKTLTVTGDKNLTIGSVDFAGNSGTGSIDASASTGNVSITLNNGAGNDAVTFKGGAGNDTIVFGGALDTNDSVDGGTGRDTVSATSFASVVAAASKLSNVEVITVAADGATATALDASKVSGLDQINFGAGVSDAGPGADATINNFANNGTVGIATAGGGSSGQILVNVKDATLGANTTDVLNVQLGEASSTAGASNNVFGTIQAPGVETINLKTTASLNAGADSVTIAADANLKSVVVTGNEQLTITTTGASITTLDASKSTGSVNVANVQFAASGATILGGTATNGDVIVGSTGNDTIDAGAGNDAVDGGAGSDLVTLGAGTDTFTLRTNGNAANLANGIIDTVKDFQLGAGGDVLNVGALAGVGLNQADTNGTFNAATITSLTGALPANSGTAAIAELIVLDSTALTAANAQALNNLLFNLGGDLAPGIAGSVARQVLVAYSATSGGPVRLAVADLVSTGTGHDIGNVRDLTVMENLTTATLSSGFNAANLAGYVAPPATVITTVANAILNNGTFNPGDNVIVQDTGANIAAATEVQLAGLTNVDSFDATDNAVALTKAQFDAIGNARFSDGLGDVVTLADTNANLTAITAAQYTAASEVDVVDATDNTLNVTVAQTLAIGNGRLTVADNVTVLDTGANIASLTALQIAGLGSVDAFNATDDAVTLNVAQVNAATDGRLTAGDNVVASDTGANLATIIGTFANVDRFDATDDVLTITAGQAAAIANTQLTAGDVVTLSDTGGNIAGLAAAQFLANIDIVDATDNVLSLTLNQANAITDARLVAADAVTVADAGATIAALTAAQLTGFTKVDTFDATDNTLSLTVAKANAITDARLVAADAVTVADTGANIAGLSAAAIAAFTKVDTFNATDDTLNLTVAQTAAATNARLVAGDDITVADTGANIAGDLTTVGFANVDKINASDNLVTVTTTQYLTLVAATNPIFDVTDTVRLNATGVAETIDVGTTIAGTARVVYTSGAQANAGVFAQVGASNTELDNTDTFAFAGGIDQIANFTLGTDKLDLTAFSLLSAAPVTRFAASGSTLNDGEYVVVRGNLAGTTFTAAAAGADSLVLWDGNTGAGVNQVGVVLTGVINPAVGTDILFV